MVPQWVMFCSLQKRLGKGQKFFDSGDYQMAKQVNFQWFWWSRVHLFLLSVKQSVPLREVQVAWGQGCLSWPNPLAQVSLPEKSKKSPFIQGWLILLRTQFLPGKAPSFRFYQNTWKTTLKESFIVSPAGGSWAVAPGFGFSFNFELLSLWFGGGKFVILRLGPSGLWIEDLRESSIQNLTFLFFQGVGIPGQPLHNPAVAKLLWSSQRRPPQSKKKSTIFNYLKRWNSIRMIRSAALTKISSTATLYLPSCCLTVFDVGYLEKLASSNKRVLTWISPLLTFLNNLRLIGIQNLQWRNLCPTASYRILQKKEMEKSACYCL